MILFGSAGNNCGTGSVHWPISQSNSVAAKQMGSVVVLRAIDMQIFQPTYLLRPNADIRDLLNRQAQKDGRKQSAFRAMMQGRLPKEQGTAAY